MARTLPRKELFDLPEGVIYLDGNSLGPLPKGALERARTVIGGEWGQQLIRAWNTAGWMALPQHVGDRIARLIGAAQGSVATGDTLSIKVYQALAAALKLRPGRSVILSDSGNFPSDLYMAEGLIRTIGKDYELRTPAPEDVLDRIDEDVAAVMLTQVDYRTGRMHDMDAVTRSRPRRRRGDDLGPRPQRRRGADRHGRVPGRVRRRLHLQISERWPRRACLHLRPP